MADDSGKLAADKLAANSDWPELVRKIRARTPARILVGRAGPAYRTETQLQLREDHAAARDAVRAELDVSAAFGAAFSKSGNSLKFARAHRRKTNICSIRRWDAHSVMRRARRSHNAALRSKMCRSRLATAYLSRRSARKFRGCCRCSSQGADARLERRPAVHHSSLPRGNCE